MYDELIKRLREVKEMLKVAQFTEAANLIVQAADAIEKLSKERKSGKWEECEVINIEDTTIEDVQSQRCSVCGKYLTTPYSYYFKPYNFCPNCGAGMR